jgi:GH3 auxin-responsive promoter
VNLTLARVAACLWTGANLPAYARYRAALHDPRTVQEALLRQYLRANAGTAFGRAHHFGAIRTVAEYQERVPLARWADVAPWVERIASGEDRVLTRAPVRVLESTAGSTTGKRIPYTTTLQQEMRRAVGPWIVDLVRQDPSLAWGRSYWAITPVMNEPPSIAGGGVRVGFEEDAEYLGGRWRRLVGATLAVPAAVQQVADLESFRYLTLRFLLQASDLALVSVWHPSFLALLIEALPRHWEGLLADVADGTLGPPGLLPERVRAALAPHVRPRPRRAQELRRIGPEDPLRIWPRLRLLSCWGDGHAALHVPALQRSFPGVRIQPKGLLATEACVSIPFEGRTPLAVRSHFFEFLEGTRTRLAHELEAGGVYSVVVTTGGGLYRYGLEDRVQVDGFVGRTPSLRFLGKEGHVSDLVGEKLREDFVAGALAQTFDDLSLHPRFALLAPCIEAARPRYVLYVELDAAIPSEMAARLERALAEHGDYRYAVALGQLAPVEVVAIRSDGLGAYLRRCQQRGQRWGAVKALALSPHSGWSAVWAPPED